MSDNVMVLSREADARRREIEVHIEAHRDAAAGNLLEVGRWLNAAKDENVVPHGEWTAWVAEHAALGERTAQLWMQAARELPEGSSLAALGTAKLRSLMALPAGEREEFAERIGADKLTSREVDAQVKAARAERDEALRLLAEKKKRMQETIGNLTDIIKKDDKEKKRTARMLDESLAREKSLRDQITDMSIRLQQEQHASMSPEAADEIRRLRVQINKLTETHEAAEKEIDRLSEALDEAQTAAMRGSMTGEGERTSPVTLILSAIGALMTQAGRAPAELARMQGLDDETRQLLAGQARMTGQWAMQVLSACGEGDAHV